jgi:hypothetical protein
MRLTAAVLLLAASVYANPTLPPLFGNHMVIQRGMDVPV